MSDSKSVNTERHHISPTWTIAVALLIFVILKLCVIDTLRIEGHSMEPGYDPGRLIFVNRLAYGLLVPFIDKYLSTWSGPERNSIVVLKNPTDNTKIVKRCIAIPGDTIRIEDGVLTIDSHTDRKINVGNTPLFMIAGYAVVPEKKYLVLGDNLDDSLDSRSFGFVALENITGSVVF